MTQTPDATRYRILLSLASGGPGSIARLSARSQPSRQAITKHLEVLSGAGLVRSDRRCTAMLPGISWAEKLYSAGHSG